MQMRNVSSVVSNPSRRRFVIGASSVPLLSLAGRGQAQAAFPSKPIALFVPGLSGGAFDFMARPVTEHAARTLGQPIVLDYKPGGGFTIAPAALATAKPDGYTLSIVVSNIVRVPLMQRVSFDPLADFTYILQVCEVAVAIAARVDQPYSTIAELVTYARANPGKVVYGSPGVGSGAHLGMEQFAIKAGIKLTHLPFRGMQEAIPAILGGHVPMLVSALEWKPYVQTGQLRPLAMLTPERQPAWADTPTLAELGFGSPLSTAAFAIAGPKDMPPAIVMRLHDAFKAAVDDPAVRHAIVARDLVPHYRSGADFRRHLESIIPIEREMVATLGLQRKD